MKRGNLYLKMLQFWEEKPEWFSEENLNERIRKEYWKGLNDREKLIISTHLENANKNRKDGEKRETAFFLLHDSGGIDIGLNKDKKTEIKRYILQYNAYLEYLKYLELQESRKSSKRAIWIAIVAIIISSIFAVIQIVIWDFQKIFFISL